jgi:hypothetical protein
MAPRDRSKIVSLDARARASRADAARSDAIQAIAFTAEALRDAARALHTDAHGDADHLALARRDVTFHLAELERAIARFDGLAPTMDRETAGVVHRWAIDQILRQPATALHAQVGARWGRMVPFPARPSSED